ncbi:MAG: response regulator, partial [Myxococcales bacterium]|nr:response regulator [Myxococcales bacterium]
DVTVFALDGRDEPEGVVALVREQADQEFERGRLEDAEERLQVAMKAISDGVWEWRSNLKTPIIDERSRALYGFGPDEPLPDAYGMMKYVDPEDVASLIRASKDHFEGKSDRYQQELTIRPPDGKTRHVLVRGVLVERDGEGNPARLIGANFDVTEAKRALHLVERQAAQMEAAKRIAKIGYWHFELESGRLEMSDVALINFGLPSDELVIGLEALRPVFSDEQWSAFLALMDRCTHGESVRMEIDLQVGAEDRTVLWQGLPAQNRAGAVTALYGTIQDVGEMKRARGERELLRSQLASARQLKGLGLMAGGIAHDFNNLLVGIMGSASMLLEDLPVDSDAHRDAGAILAASERASELIERLLAFSGKASLNREAIDLRVALSGLGPLLRAEGHGAIQLQVTLPANQVHASVDLNQLFEALNALVMNAIEATDSDRTKRIEVQLRELDVSADLLKSCHHAANFARPGLHAEIVVSDFGSGVADDHLDGIFDPFFSSKPNSRGLGLALVSGFLKAHQGACLVERKGGNGTDFRVFLPVQETDRGVRRDQKTAPRDPVEQGMRTTSVLVVDDEPTVLRLFQRMLSRRNLTVITANSGSDALQRLAEMPAYPDLLVVDLTMPEMDGVELLAKIYESRPGIPAILSSGYDRESVLGKVPQDWTVSYLQKPFQSEELYSQVAEFVGASAV